LLLAKDVGGLCGRSLLQNLLAFRDGEHFPEGLQ